MFRHKKLLSCPPPLDLFEYVRVRFNETPQDFINAYNIKDNNSDGWTYLEIQKGCYVVPQSGKLAKERLQKHIAKRGY